MAFAAPALAPDVVFCKPARGATETMLDTLKLMSVLTVADDEESARQVALAPST